MEVHTSTADLPFVEAYIGATGMAHKIMEARLEELDI